MEMLSNLARDQNIIKLTQEQILSKIEVLEINSQTGKQNLSGHQYIWIQVFVTIFQCEMLICF